MLDYKNDYGMKKIFEFLNALGWSVSLSMNNKQEYELDSLNSLTNFIHAEYEGIPGRQIAIRFNLSDETGRRMLKGGDVRLSTFLKMAEDKGFSIHIQPKDIGAIIDATDDCDAEQ